MKIFSGRMGNSEFSMIKYDIISFDNTEKIVYSLKVKEPLSELSIIGGLFEDLDHFIEWLEKLIDRNVPDFSEQGVILYQGFLWGSVKSKVIELVRDSSYIEKAAFNTADLLQLCKEWKDFLLKSSNKTLLPPN